MSHKQSFIFFCITFILSEWRALLYTGKACCANAVIWPDFEETTGRRSSCSAFNEYCKTPLCGNVEKYVFARRKGSFLLCIINFDLLINNSCSLILFTHPTSSLTTLLWKNIFFIWSGVFSFFSWENRNDGKILF